MPKTFPRTRSFSGTDTRRRRAAWGWGAGFLLLLLILGQIVRFRLLLHNSSLLIAQDNVLPTDYLLGPRNAPARTLTVLGDSTGRGVGTAHLEETVAYRVANHLAQEGYRVRVVNLAQSGAHLHDVAFRQLPRAVVLKPDIVLLLCGANDATQQTPLTAYSADLQTILKAFHPGRVSLPAASRLLIVNTPDMAYAPALPFPFAFIAGSHARQQNSVLARLTRSDAQVRIIDLYGSGILDYHQDPTLYSADLFHPSGKGYARWAELFYPALPLPLPLPH